MNKLIALTVLAVLPAFAQQELPGTGERPQPPSREGFHKKMLEKYDADKDGKLSDEEKAAMKADMEQHRGKRGPRGPRGPEGAHPGKPGMPREFVEQYDADKDGKLNEKERKAAGEAMRARMLEKYDVDKDGKLSDEEREAARKDRRHHKGGHHGHRHGKRAPRGGMQPGEDAPAPMPEAPQE